jgi:D-alanyl-D-alanine dipeptidase
MEKPVPDLSLLRRDKSEYRHYPIQPRDEICIQVDPFICHSYHWHHDAHPEGATEEIFLRLTLTVKLERIVMRLHPLGLRLLIQEGYRSLPVQKFVQEVSVLKGLRKENPHLSEDELRAKVSLFAASADGDLDTSPPPHLTGGAVDLTVVYASTGEQVDMGKGGGLYNTAYPDALENLDGFEEARRFRRLLFWLAHEEGFVVNPTEWWHLSLGDQMWAWITKAPYAVYGQAKNFA